MPLPKRNAGFTLYELMVTLAVAGIIASFGVPSFQNIMASSRSATDTNDLVTALNLARSEATRRRAPIDVCASTDGATCSASNDWSTGWIVRTQAGQVLQTWPARNNASGVLTGNVSTVQFQSTGFVNPGTNPQLSVQHPKCTNPGRRNITVSSAGRIAVARVNCT